MIRIVAPRISDGKRMMFEMVDIGRSYRDGAYTTQIKTDRGFTMSVFFDPVGGDPRFEKREAWDNFILRGLDIDTANMTMVVQDGRSCKIQLFSTSAQEATMQGR